MQNALANLKLSLTSIREIANDVDANAASALANPAVRTRHGTLLCAASVILSGFLESFLREAAEEMITEICGKGIPFQNLPNKIRLTHYLEGGAWLEEIARKERKEDPLVLAKAQDAARRLASVSSMPYEILWEAFAKTQANPGADEIGNFLKRFDIEKPIPTLAASMGWTENKVTLNLRSFIGVRNECAHTGTTTTKLTTSDLRGYCDLIEAIAEGITKTLEDTVNSPPYVTAVASAPNALSPAIGNRPTP